MEARSHSDHPLHYLHLRNLSRPNPRREHPDPLPILPSQIHQGGGPHRMVSLRCGDSGDILRTVCADLGEETFVLDWDGYADCFECLGGSGKT
jgi:hypothetical protein